MNSQIKDEKRFYIQTLGCKVNQYESQAMRESLIKSGFKECLSKDIADIYIVNTCTVTHHADKESRYLVSLFHRTNPKGKIVVTGCYVERNADNISFLPGVSYIVRNEDKCKIAEILNGETSSERRSSMTITDFKDHAKAYVKIQDGCENFCSYCKVPLVRPVLTSKPISDIVEEVRTLVKNGFKEIVLTGICLGAWGKDLFSSAIAKGIGLGGIGLSDVLKALDSMGGDFRIRLSSTELKYITDELIELISNNRRFCRHLHIPLQSGDDEILKKMNRPYTTADYRALVDKLRKRIKDIAVTTDVLVGFPGESDAHFKNTVNFIRDLLPSRTHIFTFSTREGTGAWAMGEVLKADMLKKRFHELNATALGASYLYRRNFLDQKLDILVETKRDRHSGLLTGYSDNYIKVLFEGPDDIMKKIVSVKVVDLNLAYTYGVYDG